MFTFPAPFLVRVLRLQVINKGGPETPLTFKADESKGAHVFVIEMKADN